MKAALLVESYLPTSGCFLVVVLGGCWFRRIDEEEGVLYLALSLRMDDLVNDVVFPRWFFHPK